LLDDGHICKPTLPKTLIQQIIMTKQLQIYLVLFSVLLAFTGVFGQDLKTELLDTPKKKNARKYLLPMALTGVSLVTFWDLGFLYRKDIQSSIQDNGNLNFRTRFDDYIQMAPILAVGVLKLSGLKTKNDWTNTGILLLKSEFIMMASVHGLKTLTQVQRPDGSAKTAYPSGHTAQAFMSAMFLHKEFGQNHPWLSVLGFAGASATGVLRVLNNRHWASDVLLGAAIGMASVQLAYQTHRYRWGKKNELSLLPALGPQYKGLQLSWRF